MEKIKNKLLFRGLQKNWFLLITEIVRVFLKVKTESLRAPFTSLIIPLYFPVTVTKKFVQLMLHFT